MTPTARERSDWLVKHVPLRKTVHGGMEIIRWQVTRSEVKTYQPLAPWWANPIKFIAIWALLLFVLSIVGIMELGRFVLLKLRLIEETEPETFEEAETSSREDVSAPRDLVVLTSTGVVVEGRFCGIWSAAKQGLEEVDLVENRGKRALELKFRKRGRVHIPIPVHLANDFREIVDLLKNKTYDAKSS